MEKLVIIGAGPAGVAAAKTALKLGVNPILIEKTNNLGGTCLNFGCMPTKAYISIANQINLDTKFKRMGLAAEIVFDWAKVRKYVDDVIVRLNKALALSLAEVNIIRGEAEILDNHKVKVNGQIIEAENIIVATGSESVELSFAKFDGKKIISSDDALFFDELPKSLAIIGGGVIGVEFAYFMRCFGVEVSIFEARDEILPGIDADARLEIEKGLKKQGVKIFKGKAVANISELDFEKVMVAVGRRPVKMNVPQADNVYLVGDMLVETPQYAHIAEKEGKAAAIKAITGKDYNINYKANSACIFSRPAYAFIGQVNDAESANVVECVANYTANGMAVVASETAGFIKIMVNKKTEEIIAAHILGEHAPELIGTFIPLVSEKIKITQLGNYIFPHPTFTEIIKKAAARYGKK